MVTPKHIIVLKVSENDLTKSEGLAVTKVSFIVEIICQGDL